MKTFAKLPKIKPGSQVAIISPSSGLPGIFPWVQDLGLSRIRDEFQLKPLEYPTTRTMNAPLQDRARDIMDAFKDPSNQAVIASIGGDDQIKLIKYLDPEIFINNPKAFFGYSDNTHLHNFLWNLGIPSYYGGGVMNQFAMNVKMFEPTVQSIKRALFESGEFELKAAPAYNDVGLDWSDKDTLQVARSLEPSEGWVWDGSQDAQGILWGGCVESLIVQATTGNYLPKDEDLAGTVLFIETAEDIPDPWVIEYLLTGYGERGWFDKFQAVLVGRPKAWEFNKPYSNEQKQSYRQRQREAVLRVIREYNQHIPIIQNLDFGHTDPQIVLPMGNQVRIVSQNRKIFLTY